MNKHEQFLIALLATKDLLQLYSEQHPEYVEKCHIAHELLKEALADTHELVYGIIGNTFACGDEMYFVLSKRVESVIVLFKDKGIERIGFEIGVTQEELQSFAHFLMQLRDIDAEDIKAELAKRNINHIHAGQFKQSDIAAHEVTIENEGMPVYDHSLNVVAQSITAVLENGYLDALELRGTMFTVMEKLLGNYQDFLKLSSAKRYDLATFIHMLNVSILAMFMAKKLNFAKDDVLAIGVAGLFHDIGKLFISRKILQKPGKLADSEMEKMKSHTILGAEQMMNYVDALGIVPVIVCFEHHRRPDGRGYPPVHAHHETHIASKIITICDVYDALTQRRSYKRDYPPDMVYGIMQKGKGSTFDDDLLERFFNYIGLWPVGTIVEMSNGSIGIVREVNEQAFDKPMIAILADHGENECIDLWQDSRLTIKRSLNPYSDGEKYLEFI